MMEKCSKTSCFILTCVITAVVLIIVSAITYPLLDKYVKKEVTKNVVLKEGSQLYDVWKGGKIPLTLELYLFNLTNANEVIRNGVKPNVTQIGPFVYNETRTKFNITHHGNGTVSYRENKTYVFDEKKSVGPDSLNITSVNLPLMVALSALNGYNVHIPSILADIIKLALIGFEEDLFITKSVKELVWGYNDTLLQDIKYLAPKFLKSLVPNPVVGLLYGKNVSDDGLYTVYTGEKDTSKLGIINKWNGNSSLSCWSTKYANMINGTDGSLAPPFIIDKNYKFELYSTDICRSGYATYNKVVNLHGVDLNRYTVPKRSYENATLNPDNAGFCVPKGNCWDSGVLDNSVCVTLGALSVPIVSSAPHFQYGAKKYIDAVIGMNPNQRGLTTDIDIEPMTGLVLQAAKRLQINININRTEDTKDFLGKTPSMIYPVMWLNESASADAKHSGAVRSQLDTISYVNMAQIVLFAIAAFLLLAAIVVFAIYRKSVIKTGERQPLLSEPQDPSLN